MDPDDHASRVKNTAYYLLNMQGIEGWFALTTGICFAELLWLQEANGFTGDVAEIGVHHGKSYIPLVTAARGNETVFAIDVFELQHLNVDQSGCGNRDVLFSNLARFAHHSKPKLITTSSEKLRGATKDFGIEKIRLLSIDGGHTAGLTLNDLHVANECLTPEGVCAVDDIFNAWWTGVITGTVQFMQDCKGLVPLAMIPNKLLMCRPDMLRFYKEKLRLILRPSTCRLDSEFFGTIDVYDDRNKIENLGKQIIFAML